MAESTPSPDASPTKSQLKRTASSAEPEEPSKLSRLMQSEPAKPDSPSAQATSSSDDSRVSIEQPERKAGCVYVLLEETCGSGSFLEISFVPTERELFLRELQDDHRDLFYVGSNTRVGADWNRFWFSYLSRPNLIEPKRRSKWREGCPSLQEGHKKRHIATSFRLNNRYAVDREAINTIRSALRQRNEVILERNNWHVQVDFGDHCWPWEEELQRLIERLQEIARGEHLTPEAKLEHERFQKEKPQLLEDVLSLKPSDFAHAE